MSGDPPKEAHASFEAFQRTLTELQHFSTHAAAIEVALDLMAAKRIAALAFVYTLDHNWWRPPPEFILAIYDRLIVEKTKHPNERPKSAPLASVTKLTP